MPQLDFFTFPHQFLIFFISFFYFYYFNLIVLFPLVRWMHFHRLFVLDAIVLDMFIYECFATWIVILECAVSFFFAKDLKEKFYPIINKVFFFNIYFRHDRFPTEKSFKTLNAKFFLQDPFYYTNIEMDSYEIKFISDLALDEIFFENENKYIPVSFINYNSIANTEAYSELFYEPRGLQKVLEGNNTIELYPSIYDSTFEILPKSNTLTEKKIFFDASYFWLKLRTKANYIDIVSFTDVWKRYFLSLKSYTCNQFLTKIYYGLMLILQIFLILFFFCKQMISKFYFKFISIINTKFLKNVSQGRFHRKFRFVPSYAIFNYFEKFYLLEGWFITCFYDLSDLNSEASKMKHNNLILSSIISILLCMIFLNTSLSFGAEKLMLCYFFLVIYFLLKEVINLVQKFFSNEIELSLNFLSTLENCTVSLDEKFCNIQVFLKSYLLN